MVSKNVERIAFHIMMLLGFGMALYMYVIWKNYGIPGGLWFGWIFAIMMFMLFTQGLGLALGIGFRIHEESTWVELREQADTFNHFALAFLITGLVILLSENNVAAGTGFLIFGYVLYMISRAKVRRANSMQDEINVMLLKRKKKIKK